jgi:hypothetical protein
MGLLELAGVMLKFGMALPVGIGMIGEVAGVVDTAEATSAETGISAAVSKSPITEARTSAFKATEVGPTTAEPATVEPAETTPVESPEPTAECRCTFDADHETPGQSGTCQYHTSLLLPV